MQPELEHGPSLLRKHSAIYGDFTRHVLSLSERGSDPETVLTWIEMIGTFSWFNHHGRFADGKIENIALKIGEELSSPASNPGIPAAWTDSSPSDDRRRVLHVASTVYPTGGHTRVISHWIRQDPSSCHSLLVTNQGSLPIPEWLSNSVSEGGGRLTTLSSDDSLLARAKRVREIAQHDVDLVVLHQHPNDIVPVVAFATKESPPVAIMNHADHVYWFGSSIADLVIDYRLGSQPFSEHRRYARESLVLPLPLEKTPRLTSREGRELLNIPAEQIVLLSVGQAYKYKASGRYDFFRTALTILDRNPEAHLYVIGVGSGEPYLGSRVHDRLHLLGTLEDISPYLAAADIFLNGFPGGAGLGLLQAALYEACPVSLSPSAQLLVLRDEALEGFVKVVFNEKEYIEETELLIRNKDERQGRGRILRERVADYHQGQRWTEHLEAIYRSLENAAHAPRRIPNSASLETADDIGLCQFNQNLKTGFSEVLQLAREYVTRLNKSDAANLLIASSKAHDTKICFRHFFYLLRRYFPGTDLWKAFPALLQSLKVPNGTASDQHLRAWLKLFEDCAKP